MNALHLDFPDASFDLKMGFHLVRPFLITADVASQTEFEQMYEQVMHEMLEDGFCGIWYLLTIWGEREEEAPNSAREDMSVRKGRHPSARDPRSLRPSETISAFQAKGTMFLSPKRWKKTRCFKPLRGTRSRKRTSCLDMTLAFLRALSACFRSQVLSSLPKAENHTQRVTKVPTISSQMCMSRVYIFVCGVFRQR